jgi:hypothetical protein
MQSSRTLLIVSAALIAVLAIVSGSLWYDLRSARQQIADLQDQRPPTKVVDTTLVPQPAPPPPI